MRIAIISDIHSNLEAFRQVLTDIDQSGVDRVVCLGDNVGYGPEPEAVVHLIRDKDIPCVMGNHELAIVEPRCQDLMNPNARESILLTQRLISAQTVNYMKGLKPCLIFQGSLCVHGCPPDSITTYLFQISRAKLKGIFLSMKERICFVGHTHNLEIIQFDGEKMTRRPLSKGVFPLKPEQSYIINVGSVGQPRDGDNRAKYVIWDSASHQVDVRFIPYDIAKTASRILELGFPEFNARRLW
ncbi:MAG: metallophosphoesterase family protein [Deltaproteobacteria bacterium]|jgi:predicted phosphodiesterase